MLTVQDSGIQPSGKTIGCLTDKPYLTGARWGV
jgi:hypothetical protein